eukprot:UN01664
MTSSFSHSKSSIFAVAKTTKSNLRGKLKIDVFKCKGKA